MPFDLEDIMLRIVAIEKEGLHDLPNPVDSDAVPFYFHTQEGLPYWVNRLGTFAFVDQYGEELNNPTFEITARLVIGHRTSGYKGELDTVLQRYVPHMIRFFNARELLQSSEYPDAPDNVISCRVTGGIAFGVFRHASDGTTEQIGAEFTLRLEYIEENEQAFL